MVCLGLPHGLNLYKGQVAQFFLEVDVCHLDHKEIEDEDEAKKDRANAPQ